MTTTTPTITQKFVELADMLETRYGPFDLFALFQRVRAIDRWDVVVSASWFPDYTLAGLRLIATPMQAQLTVEELVQVSHISIVETFSDDVLAIQREFSTVRKPVEVQNRIFFDKDIRRAIIIKAPAPKDRRR